MIKRTLLTLGLIVLSFTTYAQSIIQQAERAFSAGNYSDATQLYEMAASTITGNESERKKLYDAANKCRKIKVLHTQADNAYKAGNYKLACGYYNEILRYNPKDYRANSRKNEYTNVSENKAWEEVCNYLSFSEKVTGARNYLKRYPSGRFKEKAAMIIAEEEQWKTAATSNTFVAYKGYIDNSVLKVYLSEAKNAISKIDDDLWTNVKRKNTKEAYLEYIKKQENKSGKHSEEAIGLYNLFYARELYAGDEYVKAYECYIAAKDYVKDSADKQRMKKCLEYIYYTRACSASGTTSDCQLYLDKYTYKDKYYFKVKERMMILLCKEGKFDSAMRYALLKSDQKYVKSQRKAWKKAHRR